MWDSLKLIVLGVIAVFAAIAANYARDLAYQVNALTVMLAAGLTFIWVLRHMDDPNRKLAVAGAQNEYLDGPIRVGVIATALWGVVGFLVGVIIAAQLAWPSLNFSDALQGFTNFGKLRPLHTSAVIFAFGGNALIATSFYVVQRSCATRLWGGNAAWFVIWGYNLFIVLAATGYITGATHSKEYAEPEWYVDLWLTIVWVVYLMIYLGTIMKRREPHIYVANWFYLSFIVTIAMLHIVNNLAMPVSIFGSKSVPLFAGVQDAMTQWWYGHNAVGFFLTAGFLGMMYYFIPKQAERPVYSYKLSIIHFWALIFMYIWAGPHHLHYTALPEWAATLGMVFSIMLWMPSWGGMINGLMTLSGAWDKLRTDPILRMMVVAVGFYGMATFEGPMMSIKAVNSLSHYTDWTIGHVHSGALGWNGMITFGALYYLTPRLWGRERLYSTAAVSWHFWLATIGLVLYAASMWVSGIMEGLMWREVDSQGFLVNAFADTVIAKYPMLVVRTLGGVFYLAGGIIMAWNLWATVARQPRIASNRVAVPAE
ncbi:cytochrome-c oxidase, cbb3-type subunit I [Paracoccus sp. (in: a-proteobacteria)]|uniref:cytochrome-c oxidase, cbb3-type subunit I n=1 Tax=Paracoccus sp. TaxID=267 RepID=UPI0026DF056D|nr:cytochrome-c oxidase, cbb3-type subunit I [Paracoccus sp. (in: a-proteobacteria)]MDO5370256.1 cytochrome-c oxidase, cbb3-type subunit I [Paracoccus sp. (in: a-proteobacteria)]